MRIYIAGPMTGLPELNFPAFNDAATALRVAGYTVINPAELNADATTDWYGCMRTDIRELVTCDSICLLPGWTMSRGARLEFHIATQLNMQILEASALIPAVVPPHRPIWIGVDTGGLGGDLPRHRLVCEGEVGLATGVPA